MNNENERRDFLKLAGATVAGITMTTLAAGEAGAAPALMATRGGTRTLSFQCGEGVKLDHIVAAIKQGLGRFGCPACGLLGIDLHFHQGDPEPFAIDVPNIRANVL